MKEHEPPTTLRFTEQRVREDWENLLCLGKHAPQAEQVEVANTRLKERLQATRQQLDDAE